MPTHYRTTITAVGPEVSDLLDGGILILFAEGAPPELAEVSVLHKVEDGPSAEAPPVGATLKVGDIDATLTAIGSLAWQKVADMGHVVINFDGATAGGRAGELSATAVPPDHLAAAVTAGVTIVIAS